MLVSPYTGRGRWLRGNLHAHTTNSDGKFSLDELVRNYEALGYDFLVITDHNKITSVEGVNSDMLILPGCEISSDKGHIVAVNLREPIEPNRPSQEVIDAVNAQGGVAILAHPNWGENFCHWRQENLASLRNYAGIEVFNGNILRDSGSPLASDRWDMLLSMGHKCWCYGVDDTHSELDLANGWTMVLADDINPEGIVEALKEGRCYASSGVFFEAIETNEKSIRIVARNADRIAFVGRHGRWLKWVNDKFASYRIRGDEVYIRVEAFGPHGSMAWTQPFFLISQ
ncbi:MAG: CehA/McbA family metallohydrolase [Armatimonadetes bacterium]|nr:CehA/McbA family metallohydrolase [Armatimonadota bacterium]MDW8028377.1 CehA/McbA family metallohydrolase [Armatimonadota bacterium]